MERIVYVDGEFLPLADATISILDRGFLFADGIYEYFGVVGRRLIDHQPHIARLKRSLGEVRLGFPLPLNDLPNLLLDLARRNDLDEGGIYLQVTRGRHERDFAFPAHESPTLVLFTQAFPVLDKPAVREGISVVSVPDIRWQRRDIKSVALLAQVLATQAAIDAGADDAWMVEDGFVTEGASSTAYIVTTEGRIVTRPLSNAILPGVTRRAVLALAAEHGPALEERPFSIAEAQGAAEAFITGATTFVTPVVRIDGTVLGNGQPGPLTRRLRQIYTDMVLATAFG